MSTEDQLVTELKKSTDFDGNLSILLLGKLLREIGVFGGN